MSEKFTLFYKGCFAQWHRSPFEVDGIEYSHAEQFMMAEKARLFGDEEVLKKIMAADHPREQQAQGRLVTPFNAEKWNAVARNCVYNGNYAKFSQNLNFADALLATRGTTLVEASPIDRLWGIGIGTDDPRALNRSTWNGKNWLGEVLTQVRDDLIAGVKSENFNWSA